MSMDAGGLAQMSYNNNNSFQPGGIGMPSQGFASRGKGASLKRLSVASVPKIAPIAENEASTPRTSRSHLLAGLRTAPKTPTSAAPPASAPYNQRQHNMGNQTGNNRYPNSRQNYGGPQTAIGSGFPGANQYNQQQPQQQQQQQQHMMYDQVLAPPSMQYDDGEMDPNMAAQLLATELYLAQRQQQLQQQLLALTGQQFSGMNLNGGMRQAQQYAQQMNTYAQQQTAPIVQETGQPGVYLVYNQMTGQSQYVVDPNFQSNDYDMQSQAAMSNLSHSPPPPTPGFSSSPPKLDAPTLHVSPPNEANPNPWGSRSVSPPKSSTPPQDVVPLPPPSANAFRRGHKKGLSSLALDQTTQTADGPRSAFVRPVGFPATPMTGTFGPGQARAGQHPSRQPRGPPSIDELKANPTTKHEGSKNFATRQRRQAVSNLVRAGIDRRRDGSRSVSPDSETFPSSDNDSESGRSAGSGSLSGRPSIGSLRAVANGAIGSERKASKDRSCDRVSINRSYTASSVSSDDGQSTGGGLVEVRAGTPRLILTSAEKRKSTLF